MNKSHKSQATNVLKMTISPLGLRRIGNFFSNYPKVDYYNLYLKSATSKTYLDQIQGKVK